MDPNVNSQEQAEAKYGKDSYIGKTGTWHSNKNGDQDWTLNGDGTYGQVTETSASGNGADAGNGGIFGVGLYIWGSGVDVNGSPANPPADGVTVYSFDYGEDNQFLFGTLAEYSGERPKGGIEWGDPEAAAKIAGIAIEEPNEEDYQRMRDRVGRSQEFQQPVHDTVKAGKTDGVTYNKDGSVKGYNNGYENTIRSSNPKNPDTIRWTQYDKP